MFYSLWINVTNVALAPVGKAFFSAVVCQTGHLLSGRRKHNCQLLHHKHPSTAKWVSSLCPWLSLQSVVIKWRYWKTPAQTQFLQRRHQSLLCSLVFLPLTIFAQKCKFGCIMQMYFFPVSFFVFCIVITCFYYLLVQRHQRGCWWTTLYCFISPPLIDKTKSSF